VVIKSRTRIVSSSREVAEGSRLAVVGLGGGVEIAELDDLKFLRRYLDRKSPSAYSLLPAVPIACRLLH